MLEQGHIDEVVTIKDVLIQSVVTTVKKDRSVKSILESRVINISIAKYNYQMPNIDTLMGMIAETNDEKEGQVIRLPVYMKPASGQVPLDESTAKHFIFQTIGGKATEPFDL